MAGLYIAGSEVGRRHQALDGRPPAALYLPSCRPFPNRLQPIEYPAHFLRRTPNQSGTVRLCGDNVMISTALASQPIGLEPIDDGIWRVHFSFLQLGHLDLKLDNRLITQRHTGRRVLPM